MQHVARGNAAKAEKKLNRHASAIKKSLGDVRELYGTKRPSITLSKQSMAPMAAVGYLVRAKNRLASEPDLRLCYQAVHKALISLQAA